MQPYNPVKRTGTEKGMSVIYAPELIQEGLVASKIAAAYTFIPCDIPTPKNVIITPLKLGSTSDNGVALFTTTAGFQIDSLDTLSAVTDLDAFAQAVNYVVGNVVKATPTGGVEGAYVCIEANTSTTGGVLGTDFATDLAAGKWLAIDTVTFIKVTHTAASSAKVAHFTYAILGQ